MKRLDTHVCNDCPAMYFRFLSCIARCRLNGGKPIICNPFAPYIEIPSNCPLPDAPSGEEAKEK